MEKRNLYLLLLTLGISILTAVLIVVNLPIGIGLIVVLLISIIAIFLLAKPEILFYIYMIGFVFGEMGIAYENLPVISLTNFLLVLNFVILLLLSVSRGYLRNLFNSPQKKAVLIIILFLFIQDLLSSYVNGTYRFIFSRLGYTLLVILVFTLVTDRKILKQGIKLGIISMGLLSILTILRSLGVTPLGLRVLGGWNIFPWEEVLPRAIGLPQMDGGQQGVFITIMISSSIIFALSGKEKGDRFWWGYGIITFLGLFALMISQYRSSWLGCIVSILLAFWLLNFNQPANNKTILRKFFILLFSVGFIFLVILYWSEIYGKLYWFFIEVRNEGVASCFLQYNFTFHQVFSNIKNSLFGLGYDTFTENFSMVNTINEELGLHNHFLGFLYSAGLPSFLLYLLLISFSSYWYIKIILILPIGI